MRWNLRLGRGQGRRRLARLAGGDEGILDLVQLGHEVVGGRHRYFLSGLGAVSTAAGGTSASGSVLVVKVGRSACGERSAASSAWSRASISPIIRCRRTS